MLAYTKNRKKSQCFTLFCGARKKLSDTTCAEKTFDVYTGCLYNAYFGQVDY